MLIKAGVKAKLPEYLKNMIKRELFIDYKKGMSVRAAIKKGTLNTIRAWEARNADKARR